MTRQNYYARRKAGQRRAVDAELVVALVIAERQLQPRLGARKLHFMLKGTLAQAGVVLGRDGFIEVLRQKGLLLEPKPAAYPCTTNSHHCLPVFRNRIKGLAVSKPNAVWVGDLTYVRTLVGFMYLALLTDKVSRKVVGYHCGDTLEAGGCLVALQQAVREMPAGATPIHHSDQGTQYCSHEYVNWVVAHGLSLNMTETDHCAENALAERVNGILKSEYGCSVPRSFRGLSPIGFRMDREGARRTVAVKQDGTLWAWGYDHYGQVGDVTTSSKSSPLQVGGATDWQAVAAGNRHTVALKLDGTLWAWGDNSSGQFGEWTITPGKIGLPVIFAQPQDQSVQAGARVSFSVTVTGSQPWNYQWQLNGTNLAHNARLSGSQYASLTLLSPLARDAGGYEVVVTNNYGSITSAVATLTVTLLPGTIRFSMLPDNNVGLSFTAISNLSFRLEASTNLLDWETVTNYADPAGPLEYVDLCATNFPQRFYRAVWAP